ncbi:Transcription factor iws1 [Coemansia sp. RSA 552]|nr:Transcription factor iws1 [Coemansia sp. RSA 552]
MSLRDSSPDAERASNSPEAAMDDLVTGESAVAQELAEEDGVAAPEDGEEAPEDGEEAPEDGEEAPEESSMGLGALSAMPKIPKRSRAPGDAETDVPARTNSGRRYDSEPEQEDAEDEEPEQPVDPKQAEVDEINRTIDAALKAGRTRRRKRTDDDDASIDEAIVELRKRMRDATYRDIDDNKDHLPAIHKLSMLSDVVEELSKSHLYEAFLDNNIVDSIRLWLEPLDDGSLPSLDIQNSMLDILQKLPIRRDHLRESGVGKIVLFMSKCPRIPEANRRVCEQLIQQWSRMVMRLSSDYRDKRVHEATLSAGARAFGSSQPSATPRGARAAGTVRVDTGTGRNGQRLTARIPQRVAADYAIMPVSSVEPTASQRQGDRDASDKFKRLKKAMSRTKRRT